LLLYNCLNTDSSELAKITNIHPWFLSLTLTIEGPTPSILGICTVAPIGRRRCASDAIGLALCLVLIGGAAAIGPALPLVGDANAVGQALRLLLFNAMLLITSSLAAFLAPTVALSSSIGDSPRFMLLAMRHR
jgi:hypothetical protein